MRPYEAMVIFDPESEDSAINAVLDRALEILRTNGGNPGSVERWGKRTLAYEVKHRHEGYYVLIEYASEPRASGELDRLLGLADEVLRHKIVRLPDKAVAFRAKKAAGNGAGSKAVAGDGAGRPPGGNGYRGRAPGAGGRGARPSARDRAE